MNEAIESAADALRNYEQRAWLEGKKLRPWSDLPTSIKRKWTDRAMIVLQAHARAQGYQTYLERQS